MEHTDTMSELEKLRNGLEYSYWDKEINEQKHNALRLTNKLNQMDQTDEAALSIALKNLFGSAGDDPWGGHNFNCDNGKNIHVGDNFIANFNVTILDAAPVTCGNNVMIGPGTLITTINHPIDPEKRMNHLAIAKAISIGNNVWIGGNVTILPGVSIGNNSIIGAGAVVTKDVQENCIAAGVPARVIRFIK